MTIPGDTGLAWRFDKFLSYNSTLDDNSLVFLGTDFMPMTTNEKYWMALLYSASYCTPTTLMLFDLMIRQYKVVDTYFGKSEFEMAVNSFWNFIKPKAIFQSDRMYVKNMNWFPEIVIEFANRTNNNPSEYFSQFLTTDTQTTYNNLYKEIKTWSYYGRLATFLMLEGLSIIVKLDVDSNWLDWSESATATSGMLHLLGQDEEAAQFDKKHKLSKEQKQQMDEYLVAIKTYIKENLPKVSYTIFDIESSLCIIRKLFKQTRYGGYYLDRTQLEIEHYEKHFPEQQPLWNMLWKHRRDTIDNALLGELQGRHRIQTERFSDWVTKGVHGLENFGEYKGL